MVLIKTPPIQYRWIARPAITRGNFVFNVREHRVTRDASRVSRDASLRKRILRAWRMLRDISGFLDWNIYFDKGYNSPVLQSARPRAVDSGEAKMRTASWENVDKQMPRNTK